MKRLAVVAAVMLAATPAFAKYRAPVAPTWSFFQQGSDVLAAARSQIGNGAIYGRRSLWCARFMNAMLARTGHRGTGSDMAKSFAKLPQTTMRVGAIAVLKRRGGGHVGIVSGITPSGDPIVISGNHNRRVAESVYPRSRVLAFVVPM